MFRITSLVVKFVRLLKRKLKKTPQNDGTQLSDLTEAERLWILEVQLLLAQDKKFLTWKKQFNLFLDQNSLWRCGGRLRQAELSYSSNHPVLLSRDHYWTILLVRLMREYNTMVLGKHSQKFDRSTGF